MIPVIVYPLAKRYTNFPQVVLGLTFNIGAIMGYAAVTGTIDWNVVGPLYGSCIAWTVYYDSIYAFQVQKYLLYVCNVQIILLLLRLTLFIMSKAKLV